MQAQFPDVDPDFIRPLEALVREGRLTSDGAREKLIEMGFCPGSVERPMWDGPLVQPVAIAGSHGQGGWTMEELKRNLESRGVVSNVVKIVFLGNSGRGKSFLCNALLKGTVFDSRYQSKPCTTFNDFACVDLGPKTYVICNVPGLIDAERKNHERNGACIRQFFEFMPTSSTLLMYVCAPIGGRCVHEDFTAMKSLMNYLPELKKAQGTSLILNNVDSARFHNPLAEAEYRIEWSASFGECLGRENCPVELIPTVSADDEVNYQSEIMQRIHMQLTALIRSMTPVVLKPAPDAILELDYQRLERSMAEMAVAAKDAAERHERFMVAQKAEHERQVRENAKKYDERDRQHQAMVASLQSQIQSCSHQDGGCKIL